MAASPNVSNYWPIGYWHIRYFMPDYWPDPIAGDDDRTFHVAAETRTATVESENRAIYVPQETRTFEVVE